MTRSGLSLVVVTCLLPAMAAFAAQTPPADTSVAAPSPATVSTPAATSPATPGSLPTRGMDMANVEHIYGPPDQKLAPVPVKGTPHHPPITRWIYPTFVVYFEYNHVVHAVIKAHPFKNGDSNKQ